MAPARRSRRQTADTAIIDWTDHAVLADLSPELLNRVFQHLSSSSQSKGSVAVIALGNASRTLREIAVRHLFRRIVYEFSEVRRNDRYAAISSDLSIVSHDRAGLSPLYDYVPPSAPTSGDCL
jgi:hypothetical protein